MRTTPCIIASVMLLLDVSIVCAQAPSPSTQLKFYSNDAALQSAFDWARDMALSYSHIPGDPVGPWCEAALPQREAFCIRDVCHQSIGAHLLGLDEQNMNMMQKFVSNIAPSRHWCTYWELDRYDRPAPIDYRSDKEFWYNLNANLDIIHTAWRLYNWTADQRYVRATDFSRFYNLSLADYLYTWQLRPDDIMSRPRYMNRADDVTPDNQFYHCRGIPSYVENFPGICVGLDLLASLYAGHEAAANISELNESLPAADTLRATARAYRDMIDSRWWDGENSRYHTFYTETGDFAYGEGIPFALWFGIIGDDSRRDACVRTILAHDWNIENLSYFPAMLFDMGYSEDAYRLLVDMPGRQRSEYPEVSFGLIEAIVRAAMGIVPDATAVSLTTELRLPEKTAVMAVENVPLFGGTIDLRHDGATSTTLVNNTHKSIAWTPVFSGEKSEVVNLAPGQSLTVTK